MLISCNQLKKYIKNADDINFKTIWDTFTLKTAEVENVYEKGNDLKDVVTAKIISCEKHPDSKKLSLLKVFDGSEEYDIVCGAPNVKVGLIGALVKVGGMVSNIKIEKRKLAGYYSYGMMCAMDELGIGDAHDGIIEFDSDTPLGVDICDLFNVKDIIVEIDNKSLTNRPDLWGHYGIAREIAAITNHELLPLDILEVTNDKEDLDISVREKDFCPRYCGIKIANLINNKTPLDMQIFLYYTGMRSINLFVDLTNYLMLELGQPMHAFDARVVKNIEVLLAKDLDTYTTLDGINRTLYKDTLMISNGKKYFGIAGIMGGLDSEILNDTTSIFLESANFLAGSIRKSAVKLGLRTEASARYEKSLDPNLCDFAIKRLLYLLKQENPQMQIVSNLTDIYSKPLKEKEIVLSKKTINRYCNLPVSDKKVKEILVSLGFKVDIKEDCFVITVPTYRATKDISLEADIIEEILRMIGYDKLIEQPLNVDITANVLEDYWEQEYKVKKYLATAFNLHEVHSYLWYSDEMLNKLEIKKEGVKLLSQTKNNLLRDDLSLSLLPIVKNNLKNFASVKIFEIGTIINDNQNEKHLSIILADDESNIKNLYQEAKGMVISLFKALKNKEIIFKEASLPDYYNQEKSKAIIVDDVCIGNIIVTNGKLMRYIGKKKAMVMIDINFEKYVNINKNNVLFKEISKYQVVYLDYTLVASKEVKYADIAKILDEYSSKLILGVSFIDVYEDDKVKKFTIRYQIGSYDRTLESTELENFKNDFIKFVQSKGLEILF